MSRSIKEKYETSRIDLYRSRRDHSEKKLPLLKSTKKYFNRGIIYGLYFLSIVIIFFIPLRIRSTFLSYKKAELDSFAKKHDIYVENIQVKNQELKAIKDFNLRMAKEIAGLRSSSALLSEISNLMPSSIELSKIKIYENNITIKGNVNQQNGIKIINLFLLHLKRSLFVNGSSVKLLEAKEFSNNSDNINYFKFTIVANLSNDLKRLNRERMYDLGSIGLYNRIKILEEYNLLQ
tara:strand:- start:11597 stop:12301 length:705 start_codon:yes stop_codon:yes gene_type:complete